MEDLNEKHLVLSYQIDKTKIRVYLLNPGEWFQGFGGSRHAKPVTKTASLIIRYNDNTGLRDHEYDLADKDAWAAIHRGIAMSLGHEVTEDGDIK